ncbi:MAG: hypothetical protein EOP35_08205, partial [Rubrivivax sp.]
MLAFHALAAPLTAHDDGRLAAARHAFSAPERMPLNAGERAALATHAQPPLRHEGLKLARWTMGAATVPAVHEHHARAGAHRPAGQLQAFMPQRRLGMGGQRGALPGIQR